MPILQAFVTLAVVCYVGFWSCAWGQPPASPHRQDSRADPAPAEIKTRLDRFLTDQQQQNRFSGIVLIAKGETILWKQGYGMADRERSRPFSHNTVLTVGSLTKQFTGAAIMKLIEQHQLRSADTIDQYFDHVPADKRQITVHQLLTHSAGFPGGIGDDFDLRANRNWYLARALDCKLGSPPGTKYAYSNVGYSLLGILIEIISGESYETFLQRELFHPAGMKRTGYMLPKFVANDVAVGYRGDRRWGTVLEQPMLADGPSWHLRANGGVHSTVDDIYRWHLALRGDQLLSPESKQQYFAPHVDEGDGDSFYGYGWVNWRTAWGTRMLSHDGGNGYHSAEFRRYLDDDVMIFVAANADVKAWDIIDQLEAITFDL